MVLEEVLELRDTHVPSSSIGGHSVGTLSLCRPAPSEYKVGEGLLLTSLSTKYNHQINKEKDPNATNTQT